MTFPSYWNRLKNFHIAFVFDILMVAFRDAVSSTSCVCGNPVKEWP